MASKNPETCSKKLAERDSLAVAHLYLAKAVALQIRHALPAHVELDDLVHAGVLGLLDAAGKFDPQKQVAFTTYAKYRIRGAILDAMRELDCASRRLRRQWKRVESGKTELIRVLQRDPTEAEIAAHLQIDMARLRKILLQIRSAGEISTSPVEGEEGDGLRERQFESGPGTRPEYIFSRVQARAALGNALGHLRPRQQQVVRAYYNEHRTMKEIGVTMGINESRVSQLHKSALEKMRYQLMAMGVSSSGAF